jgi:hypothetical protein
MELIFEFIAQLVFELIAELLTDRTFRHSAAGRSWGRFLLYFVIGGVLGGLSLLILPQHLIAQPGLRVLALISHPILLGGIMAYLGKRRARRADDAYGLEAFWPAWGFAFCFGLVRMVFAS